MSPDVFVTYLPGRSPLLDVFEPDASARTNACSSLLDAPQKPRVVFKSVVKPVVLRLEPDKYTRWPTVARDNDVLCFGFSQKAGQVVFDLRKGHFLHFGLPNCANHHSASGLSTIVKTSTVEPDTS